VSGSTDPSPGELTQEELAQAKVRQAYGVAIRLLTRRDHCVAELTRKLRQLDYDHTAIVTTIDTLLAANYVNDARYAQVYAEQRKNQGYGPMSIRAKLIERGLDSLHIENALRQPQVNWAEQARSVIEKRFSADAIIDTGQQATARIARFLHGRGFSPGDSLLALTLLRQELTRQSSI
jgi:regulatory protein